MILSTSAGASSGGSATPLSSAVASSVPPLIALGAAPRLRVAAEAGPGGLGALSGGATLSLVAPSSFAVALETRPATGSTTFRRGLGSGGRRAAAGGGGLAAGGAAPPPPPA